MSIETFISDSFLMKGSLMATAPKVDLLTGDELDSFITAQTMVALARPEVWETVKQYLDASYVTLVEANLVTEANKAARETIEKSLHPDAKLADNFEACLAEVIELANKLYDYRGLFVGKDAGSQGRGNKRYLAYKFTVPVAGGELIVIPRQEK